MKITDVTARWLRCPIPIERQHTSDFGTQSVFDMALVCIETDSGLVGFGEGKAAVGSSGACASIAACVQHELRPLLLGRDPRNVTQLWESMYSGSRAGQALERGRSFPVLGRRGLTISAMSGVDMALWDILGQSLGVPIVQLLGGACRERMPAYASGGWAPADRIGEELRRPVDAGFRAIKMRVGLMDGSIDNSIARVRAAREALGADIALMCDAHGTMTVPEAKRFCKSVEDCGLYWFEEPCSPDNLVGTAEVRASTSIPIALGESVFTRFDIRDAIECRAMDVVQPDAAIIGGPTEARRVATLAETHEIELAPHLWGSALSFMAGLHVAFASPAARVLECALGGNPMIDQLVAQPPRPSSGSFACPAAPGLGVTVLPAFIDEYAVRLS